MRKIKHFAFSILHFALCTRRHAGAEGGQALVEYAIVFPLQLMMTLAIIQLAQIFVAKQVVEYAAFCGARATLVGLTEQEAQNAVWIPLSGVCASSASDASGPILPGWGSRTMSSQTYQAILNSIPAGPDGDVQRAELNAFYNTPQTNYLSGYGIAMACAPPQAINFQTVTASSTSTALPGTYCNVTFNYPLQVPVGNLVDYAIGQVFLGVDSQYLTTVSTANGSQPALVMTASCVLPSPPGGGM